MRGSVFASPGRGSLEYVISKGRGSLEYVNASESIVTKAFPFIKVVIAFQLSCHHCPILVWKANYGFD